MKHHKYWNNQKYCECQLIVLWNVAIFYEIKIPVRYGYEYIEDCKKASAFTGGCINTDHVIEKLGLKAIKGELNKKYILNNLPLEFKIICRHGYHSVLSIDVNLNKEKLLLANYVENRLYWLSVERLIKIHNRNLEPIKWNKNK